MKELRPDSMIQAHALGHHLDIGFDFFAKIGDLVDKRNLRGQERIGRVLDELGSRNIRSPPIGVSIQIERTIEILHDGNRLIAVAPILTRFGRIISMADPSRRNSGFEMILNRKTFV